MDHTFFLKLFLSFMIGGLWTVAATVVADRYGSKIGGLIAGLPSTVMFGLLFLAWTQSAAAGVQATTLAPIAAGFTCLFILGYCVLVKRGLWIALPVALILWMLLAYGLVSVCLQSFSLSLAGYIFLFALSFYVLERILRVPSVKGKPLVYTPAQIVMRGLLSGTVIAFVVYLGKIAGPVIGGMMSMFPAMFTGTILITYFAQGAAFSAAVMKSSMVSAVTTVIYAATVRFTYMPLGIVPGTIVSVLVSFSFGYLINTVIVSRLR
jgi:hypothetical protein